MRDDILEIFENVNIKSKLPRISKYIELRWSYPFEDTYFVVSVAVLQKGLTTFILHINPGTDEPVIQISFVTEVAISFYISKTYEF